MSQERNAYNYPAGARQYGGDAAPSRNRYAAGASTPLQPRTGYSQGQYRQTAASAQTASGGTSSTNRATPQPRPRPPAAETTQAASTDKAPKYSPVDALKLTPTQKDVDYARPSDEEAAQCKISFQTISGAGGWVVEDSRGATLRKFLDTNGDGRLDQWCYYKDGMEVYRDIDSDFNGKVDQCRWFSLLGTRWGIDRDEDGVIDSWRLISPEEVAREVIHALVRQDADRFARLVLTQDELRSLGLGEAKATELAQKTNGAVAKFKAMAGQQKSITSETKWLQFSGSQPGIIAAGSEGSTKDIEVYENVLAIVQTGSEHAQVQIGTLVHVGSAWRVIDAPQQSQDATTEAASTGFFFRNAAPARPQVAAGAPSEKSQALMSELEKLDAAVNRAATADEQAPLNAKRADILEQLATEATKPEDRAAWIRQMADMVSASVQSGGYPAGAKRLETLFDGLQKSDENKTLAAYVRFRQLTAEYGLSMQSKGADVTKIQADWLKRLEQYVADYPKSNDSAEAILQLAIAQEYAGQEEEAKKWYGQILRDFPDSTIAKKAAGARRRLESVGKILDLQGKSPTGEVVELARLRGKVVLIQYWATWCEPCKADMVLLKDLLEKSGSAFTVLGVNLDSNPQSLTTFLSETKLPWPQIYEEGGLESRPALELGILTLPTMVLVDQEGKVVNRNISTSELAGELKKLIR